MKISKLRVRKSHALITVGALALSGPISLASAQSPGVSIPLPQHPNELEPEVRTTDEFGVDLVSIQMNYSLFLGSIGPSDNRGFTVQRRYLTTSMADVPGGVSYRFFDDDYGVKWNLSNNRYSISGMGLSGTFSTPAGSSGSQNFTFVPVNDKGKSLVYANGIVTFTDRDGTIAVWSGSDSSHTLRADYVIFPNGLKVTFSDTITRNNLGYRLLSTGFLGHYTFVNEVYQDPTSNNYSQWNSTSSQTIGGKVYYCNVLDQCIRPEFVKKPTTRVPNSTIWQEKDYLHRILTNFEPTTTIDYREGPPTSGAAGSRTHYVKTLTKGELTLHYTGVWAFDYGGYGATFNGQRRTAANTGDVMYGVSGSWRLGQTTRPTSTSFGGVNTSYGYNGFNASSGNTESMRSFSQDGIETVFTRDGRDNIIETRRKARPGSNLPDIVTTATFPSSCTSLTRKVCNKPTSVTDANGNVTSYEYSTAHGGLTKRTLPAGSNGIRPQTRYSYAQKYAWFKSGNGYVQAATPVWVLVSEEFCKTTAAIGNGCAGGASDEVVTTYQYEEGSSTRGSNLLLLGTAVTADDQTLRTCFSYDKHGRQISQTQPKAGLATCPA